MALRDLDFSDGVTSSTAPTTPPATPISANFRHPASASLIASPPAVGTSLMQDIGGTKEAILAAETAADAGSAMVFTITVDTLSSTGTAAVETLTLDSNPNDGDSFDINDPRFGPETITFKSSPGGFPEIQIGGNANATADNLRTDLNSNSALVSASGSSPAVILTLLTVGAVGGNIIDNSNASTTSTSSFADGTEGTLYEGFDNQNGVGQIFAGPSWTPGGTTTVDATNIAQAITNEIPGWTASSSTNVITVTRDAVGNQFTIGFSYFNNDGHSTGPNITNAGTNALLEGFRDAYLGQFIAIDGTDAVITNSYIEEIEVNAAIIENATVSPVSSTQFKTALFDGIGSDFQTHVTITASTAGGQKVFAQRVEIIGT